MTNGRHRRLEKRKRRIQHRLRQRNWPAQEQQMLRATNIHHEVADRTQAVGVGTNEPSAWYRFLASVKNRV